MTGAKPACNRYCNAQAGQKGKQAGMFFDRNHLKIESMVRRLLSSTLSHLGGFIRI
ncbi:MAG: hypothetical protein BECKG1743D_GA0114223_103025 [Candidatus Kentron sp. G]|nr:MAG: hypothetical protein BECKG1743D_GA0114223_103025 [Candidatus Kentron sp. G]